MGGNNENDRIASPERLPIHLNTRTNFTTPSLLMASELTCIMALQLSYSFSVFFWFPDISLSVNLSVCNSSTLPLLQHGYSAKVTDFLDLKFANFVVTVFKCE